MSEDVTESVVEVRVEEVIQLFDTLDPFPFRERDLDKDAEDYIVSWARELPPARPIKIVIHAPAKEVESALSGQLQPALSRYFNYRAEAIDRDLRELFRVGRRALGIGLATLAVCVLVSSAVTKVAGTGTISRFFEEGLVILGWVANWKPIQTFLYDWWPVAGRRDLYRRLAAAKVELQPLSVREGS
ncbi:MAG: hypothetical protein ACXW4Z_09910 [Candidatus Binatia bacterium]